MAEASFERTTPIDSDRINQLWQKTAELVAKKGELVEDEEGRIKLTLRTALGEREVEIRTGRFKGEEYLRLKELYEERNVNPKAFAKLVTNFPTSLEIKSGKDSLVLQQEFVWHSPNWTLDRHAMLIDAESHGLALSEEKFKEFEDLIQRLSETSSG